MTIYADNAATTKMSRAAIDAMLPYFDQIYGNPSSVHCEGQKAAEAISRARESIAQTLGCAARELYFTSGGSEADNQAILSAAAIGERKNKKHIISSTIEHHAVLHTLEKLQKRGFEVTLLDAHENGIIKPEELAAAIRPDTVLASIMFANNEIGSIQPVAQLGQICRENGVIFHTDAVQAVGHIRVDVKQQNIDMLSLSAHKFHGPKGVGALYVRKGIAVTNLIAGGAQERGRRAGTENVPGIMGMAAALKQAAEHMEEDANRIIALRDRLIRRLTLIPQTVLNGDPIARLPGNVNLCFAGIEGETLLFLLDEKGICASSGAACSSGALDPSHVLLAIGRSRQMARSALRLSLSEENTPEEIEYIITTITQLVSDLRDISLCPDREQGSAI